MEENKSRSAELINNLLAAVRTDDRLRLGKSAAEKNDAAGAMYDAKRALDQYVAALEKELKQKDRLYTGRLEFEDKVFDALGIEHPAFYNDPALIELIKNKMGPNVGPWEIKRIEDGRPDPKRFYCNVCKDYRSIEEDGALVTGGYWFCYRHTMEERVAAVYNSTGSSMGEQDNG